MFQMYSSGCSIDKVALDRCRAIGYRSGQWCNACLGHVEMVATAAAVIDWNLLPSSR